MLVSPYLLHLIQVVGLYRFGDAIVQRLIHTWKRLFEYFGFFARRIVHRRE